MTDQSQGKIDRGFPLSPEEAANSLGVSLEELDRLSETGELVPYRLKDEDPKRYLVGDVLKYIARRDLRQSSK